MRLKRCVSPGLLLRAADFVGVPQQSAARVSVTSSLKCGPLVKAPRCTTDVVRLAGRLMPYAVYSPPAAGPRPLPVILFLHGAGERGTDGVIQTKVGIGPALCAFPHRYPAHVVMPQCGDGEQWSGTAGDAALMALDHTIRMFGGDEQRIYLTGVSMGASGALRLAARYPTRFAAVVPICGWADARRIAVVLKTAPMWLFHGASDPVVPVGRSRQIVEALRSAGATDVRYTEYPGIGHESWDLAYAEQAMPEWLFTQSRR
jgi:predicted peptidase